MTLGALNELTRSILKRYQRTATPAEIRRRLNQAQSECSTELDRPTKSVVVSASSRDIPLPADCKPAGLKALRAANSEVTFELLTVQDADQLQPDWHLSTAASNYVAVYDPGVLDDGEGTAPSDAVRLSRTAAELGLDGEFLITYVVEPQPMVSSTDVPFNGSMPEYHHVLAHYAAYLITGQPEEIAHYRRVLDRASADYSDKQIINENVFYTAHMNRGR